MDAFIDKFHVHSVHWERKLSLRELRTRRAHRGALGSAKVVAIVQDLKEPEYTAKLARISRRVSDFAKFGALV